MPQPTVLVLGAGASLAYGYPTGSELRRKIVALQNDLEDFSEQCMTGRGELRRFFEAFQQSAARSIDRFLARNPEFARAGKSAIARILFESENTNLLYSDGIDENWYSYLVNLFYAQTWDELDPSWLTIVTFNYDRSLQEYLVGTMHKMYAKSRQEVRERLKPLRILPVYGSLGSPDEPHVVAYGGALEDTNMMHAAIGMSVDRLRVMEEGRNDDEHLGPIQEALEQADRIAFLGFGFDKMNVERFGDREKFGTDQRAKQVVATTVGLHQAEISRIKGWLFGGDNTIRGSGAYFNATGCESLFRTTLVLER